MNDHADMKTLLGAFALNALPAEEMQQLEQHVATCAECAHEVRLLREASTQLAWLPSPEDPGELVERIAAALPRRPRRIVTRVAVGIAAIAIVVAGLLGATLVRERSRNGDLVHVVAAADRTVTLAARRGFEGRGRVYLGRGRAAVILDNVPDPGHGRAYQLWAIKDAKPVSMTIVHGRGRVERAFRWTLNADEFAITIEPLGGSPVPTSNPVLAGR
jgi:anti-sigma-K factor RskA